ncbi:MAG TPA: LysM peptidoglycan-binding domain-containing protein [Acidimicrobiia bacterium]|nr:LysM peptidoglycan-binding domain-containing protein [Acidimicrobiia bacterium]
MPVDRRVRVAAVATALTLFVAIFSVGYTVKQGDTLGAIARDNEVSLSDLVAANMITNPNLIRPGQVLVIPVEDKTHVVARGESLFRIAAAYGITVGALTRANQLSNPNLISPGQILIIPGATGSGSGSTGGSSGGSDGESEGSNQKPGGGYTRSGRFHIVKKGETLESIAAQYIGVSVKAITDANGITRDVIYIGTRLFLDGPAYIAKGTSGSGSYTVQKGDRLIDIASRYGTSITKIASSNGITNLNLIRAGQILVVPDGGTTWVCPVQEAGFFNDWGFPRAGGARFHEGNDLFTTHGAPIRAPVAGTVTFKTGPLGGLQFNLRGSDGVEYVGSHLDSKGKEGKVAAGDIIGYVGTSGNALGTRPHLHFGMYLSGLVINPYPTLIANGCK